MDNRELSSHQFRLSGSELQDIQNRERERDVYGCVHKHICINVNIHRYAVDREKLVCVQLHVCMCVCTYIYIYMCVCVHVYMHTHAHIIPQLALVPFRDSFSDKRYTQTKDLEGHYP